MSVDLAREPSTPVPPVLHPRPRPPYRPWEVPFPPKDRPWEVPFPRRTASGGSCYGPSPNYNPRPSSEGSCFSSRGNGRLLCHIRKDTLILSLGPQSPRRGRESDDRVEPER